MLDNIGKKMADVRKFVGTPDEEMCMLDASIDDLYSLWKEKQIWVSLVIGAESVDSGLVREYLNKIMPGIMEKIDSIPAIRWVSRAYVLKVVEIGSVFICIETDVRTAYESVRVLCSLIGIFCRVGDGWISFLDIRKGQTRKWVFKTRFASDEFLDDDRDGIGMIFSHLLGRPVGFVEMEKCLDRFRKLFGRICG